MARTPVIFVPGLCGSFNLLILLDFQGPRLTGWNFPPFISYGKGFLEAFERAGYVRDADLFVAFYDWRKSVQDAARLYLKPWIDRAKRRAGAEKVILIGHSMGGLVARSYIQSPDYAHDVARLFTLGTPHRGAGEAYYAWGGGELRADPSVKVVFDVYLWYLRHAHPFQTQMDPLRTIRTQTPGIRDLLPIDSYLLDHQGSPLPRPEASYQERNLVGLMLNQPAQLDLLARRVPVTTIRATGFPTIRAIVVGDPPIPPGDPPRFPDGAPVQDEVDTEGDGTVRAASAGLVHPYISNLGPLAGTGHGVLPDHPAVLDLLFNELRASEEQDLSVPPLGAPPVEETKLVVLTASPVTMVVETPSGPPLPGVGVLGAPLEEVGAPVRPRRVRARDHGHSGKHLNIAVIANPPAGAYRVHLHGTATGSLALGAMLVSAGQVIPSGAAEGAAEIVAAETRHTRITTVHGQVADGTDLFYEVVITDVTTPPDVHLDARVTAADAMAKLRAAAGGVLAAEALGQAPPEVREAAEVVLGEDAAAPEAALETPGGAGLAAMVDALVVVAREVVGAQDVALAEALMVQLQALKTG